MLDFQLFRVKVLLRQQRPLLEKEPDRPDIIKQVISSLPSAEFRKGMVWHVGNIEDIDAYGLYFRVGRTTKTTVEVYQDGRFLDQTFETAPYTHALIDLHLELCAIARKTKLSPSTTGIARQLARLLQESQRARELEVDFEINEINDPDDFISYLKQAYSISKFWVLLSRPNAFDANEHFVKPFQKMVEESNGSSGKAELKGQNLNSQILETVARSAAATGDDAAAWIKTSQRATAVKKRLKGNPVSISQEDIADKKERKRLLYRIRELYGRIRGGDHEQ